MKKTDQAEKKRLLVDGVEYEGLVRIAEIAVEEGTVEVPSFNRITTIKNGIKKYPPIEVKYKITRNSQAWEFYKRWRDLNEFHNVTIIRCDANGVEFERALLPNCEVSRLVDPEYAAENPQYAQFSATLLPEDITYVGAE